MDRADLNFSLILLGLVALALGAIVAIAVEANPTDPPITTVLSTGRIEVCVREDGHVAYSRILTMPETATHGFTITKLSYGIEVVEDADYPPQPPEPTEDGIGHPLIRDRKETTDSELIAHTNIHGVAKTATPVLPPVEVVPVHGPRYLEAAEVLGCDLSDPQCVEDVECWLGDPETGQ